MMFIMRAKKTNSVVNEFPSNVGQKKREWPYHLKACELSSFSFSSLKNKEQCEIEYT